MKYLVIHISPEGKTDVQFEKFLGKEKEFFVNIHGEVLNIKELITVYKSTWEAKIRYIISNIWFTRQQNEEI